MPFLSAEEPRRGGGGPGGGGPGGGGAGAPPYMRGTGSRPSTACGTELSVCPADGGGNFKKIDLKYNAVEGTMSGTVTSNNCPDHGGRRGRQTPTCTEQTIPDPSFRTLPMGAPLLGSVGAALTSGVYLFGPFEAGFALNQICAGGSCQGGVDVMRCEQKMACECGISPSDVGIIDSCGGHANPYHYHKDMTCLPNRAGPPLNGGHSPALAVVLDGRLIYGQYEGDGKRASDLDVGGLDACNGHYGTVPADPELGVPSHCTYHYHTTAYAPFTVGCFGPVGSLEQCKSLYEGCGTGYDTFKYDAGSGCVEEVAYDNWCPCYQQARDTGVCTQAPTPGPGPAAPGPGAPTPGPAGPKVSCTDAKKKNDCKRLPRTADGDPSCIWAKKQCSATQQNGGNCASFMQYKRKKRVCKRAGCQWVKQGRRKGACQAPP